MRTNIEKCIKCARDHEWNFMFSFSTDKLAKQVIIACCPTCSTKINNMVADQWAEEIKILGNRLKR